MPDDVEGDADVAEGDAHNGKREGCDRVEQNVVPVVVDIVWLSHFITVLHHTKILGLLSLVVTV